MKFKLIPILQRMQDLYQLPLSQERFEQYLLMLQGEQKADMILPITGYNPMGKEHVLSKIKALQNLDAEQIIQEELNNINAIITLKEARIIQVVLNLADDVGGAWTNRYTTDFSSKFDIGALVKRNFCAPYFWTSETYTKELIIQRTRAYLYRTLYVVDKGQPKTLKEHVEQEVYVQTHSNHQQQIQKNNDPKIENFYLQNLDSEEYNLIFNFFYGDEASELLGYKTYGMKKNAGWNYIKSDF